MARAQDGPHPGFLDEVFIRAGKAQQRTVIVGDVVVPDAKGESRGLPSFSLGSLRWPDGAWAAVSARRPSRSARARGPRIAGGPRIRPAP